MNNISLHILCDAELLEYYNVKLINWHIQLVTTVAVYIMSMYNYK